MGTHEKVERSVLKSVTFRLLVVIADGAIIYFITKSFTIAVSVIVFSNVSSTLIYYFHERAWAKLKWGKKWSWW